MLLAHELQHQETMLQLLQLVDGYEPVLPLGTAPVAAGAPADVRWSTPAATRSAPPSAASPTTTSAAATRSSSVPSKSTDPRSTNSSYSAVHGGDRSRAAAVLGARGRGLGRRREGPAAPRSRPTTRSSTSPGRRPTPSPAGPASGCRPSRSGRPRASGSTTSGQAWEWTSSHFLPYPGFEAFPYREYSEVFFGDTYRVLRGSSWATHPRVARPSFRNWDLPQRRQIFAGIRCARDAA